MKPGSHVASFALALVAMAAMAFAAAAPALATEPPDAAAILRAVEANQVYGSIEYEGSMTIVSGAKTRVKTMRTWSLGKDKAFIEFTNPEDRGVRMLKLGDSLWTWFPKERDTVRISGYLLTQGMMGSDVSYQDAMEPDSLLDSYDAAVAGTETVGGRSAWLLELTAKSPQAGYSRRRLWVDAERYVTLKSELYARSGMLLKASTTLDVARIGARYFPSKVEISDKLKKDSKTVFAMTSLKLDTKIDESRFTLQALSK